MQLFKSQLKKSQVEEPVQLASQPYPSPRLNRADSCKFDLLIEYLDRDAPDDYELRGFEKKLNGVI